MSRTGARDRRVYQWEDRVVAPLDRSVVTFANMQALVDHVWQGEGLRWPPRVRPKRKSAATIARANRLAIEAPDELPSWILLHEIAHAMADAGEGDALDHGPDFVGLYLRLLVRYARLEETMLSASLRDAGIKWNPQARPAFLES